MRNNEMGKVTGAGIGGFGIGILAGAVIGGVLALLYTPKSGSEMRAMMMGRATQTRDAIQNRVAQVREKVTNRGQEVMK